VRFDDAQRAETAARGPRTLDAKKAVEKIFVEKILQDATRCALENLVACTCYRRVLGGAAQV